MKKYTKPRVVKVTLNPEQAVLGTCMAGVGGIRDAMTFGCKTSCKQGKDFKTADYAFSS